jgi:signal transduction histidine kinase
VRVATRLSGALAILVTLLLVLLAYHVRTLREAVATSFELSDLSGRVFLAATEQVTRLTEMEENAGKYWVTGDPGYRALYDEAVRGFDATLADLGRRPLEPEERRAWDRLHADWAAFRPAHAELGGQPEGGLLQTIERLDAFRAELDRLSLSARALGDAAHESMEGRLERSASAAARVERLSWGAASVALTLAILVAVLTVRSITRALRRLRRGTRAVAEGDFEHRLDTSGNDEFAELARDFNVMTRRLGELDSMKRDFLSKVSHDLKTPLASIQETQRVLMDEVPGPLTEAQRRLLQLSAESGDRLSAMIADILDLSAMEAGAVQLELRPEELVGLLERAVREVEPVAAERGVTLALSRPDRPLELRCDARRIVQLAVNLLENAIKFSPPGGRIGILVEPHGPTGNGSDEVVVRVEDQGPGVSAAERERIFERFYQAEAGRAVRGRGVGLGLAICREIATSHGGRIWVDSPPGGGSVFSFSLPVETEVAVSSQPMGATSR